jgi:DNA polymerase-3 subunit epsilon/ATP-dependent DNA helicase DinG
VASSTYVSLDLELVEANSPAARIIEIGAVRFDSDGAREEWSTLVNPGVPVPYAVRLLTGIETADLAQAPPLAKVVPALRSFVGDDPIVGQSIDLDVAQLAREGVALPNPLLDTFELATLLLPGLTSYDLASVARALGIFREVPHRAIGDAHLAREVFLALRGRIGELDLDVLMHINRLASALAWPYVDIFQDAERERRRRLVGDALGGAALGQIALGLTRVLEPPESVPEPLVPHAQTRRLDVDALVGALSAGGAVAGQLAAYEERPEQLAMLRAICEAFTDEHHIIVEAGTGTGKSLAYLLPSLAFASANNRRVVISTNTINLQDQLFDKDVPDLVEAMGYRVRASVLKGRSNYLCLRRWLALLRADSFTADEITLLIKTLIWIGQTTTGDRAELRLTPGEEIAWSRICSQAETCSPLTCPYHREGSCFIARARRLAEASHVLIVNHALLLSDVSTNSRVLPEYEHLVIDEAHHVEHEATSQLGWSSSLRSLVGPLDALFDTAEREGGGTVRLALTRLRLAGLAEARATLLATQVDLLRGASTAAHGHLTDLFETLRELVTARAPTGDAVPSVRITPAVRRDALWLAAEGHWRQARAELETIRREIAPLLEDLADAAAAGAESFDDLLAEVMGALHQLETATEQTHAAVGQASGESICWLTFESGTAIVHSAPLDVAAHVQKWLLNAKSTVALTSATLSTDGSFDYIRGRLGAQSAEELLLGSPFDYERAALLLLPQDLPEPSQPGYTQRAAEAIGDIAAALGGRTLALFTSYAQLRATHQMLRERMERASIMLMGQGIDGPRGRLLQRFRTTERALLLGTASFWEGVDVVGEALSALVIARLPFAVPTDPVFAARSEQFDDPFNQYAVPQAILRFKQGFGRLIRSQSDRGVVAVLDRRILTKSYGAAFLNSLPSCTVRVSPVASFGIITQEWLEDHRDALATIGPLGTQETDR